MPSKGFKVFKGLEGLEGFKGLRVGKRQAWTFRRKTYLPKACNFYVQMPGTLNWRTKHAREKFTRCGLGAACWLRDGFDLGKRRRRSSTPAVVPGAAPALAKAGVGGYSQHFSTT